MTGPLMLIVIGVLFLLNNLFPSEFSFGRMWPVILIAIGFVKVIEYFRGPAAARHGSESRGNSDASVRGTGSGGDGPRQGEGL